MTDTFQTMIVPADLAPLARSLAAGLSPGGVNMFTVGLSPNGQEPATHYVSTGYIATRFAECIADAALLHQACLAAEPPAEVTLAQCEALVSRSDVSAEEPFAAFARLTLTLTP